MPFTVFIENEHWKCMQGALSNESFLPKQWGTNFLDLCADYDFIQISYNLKSIFRYVLELELVPEKCPFCQTNEYNRIQIERFLFDIFFHWYSV